VKAREVHDMADDQLAERVASSRQEVFNLRVQHATGQLENTARIGQAKRDLARALTVANERGLDVDAELRKLRAGG
jgi:large subunit ribosomal protein L29